MPHEPTAAAPRLVAVATAVPPHVVRQEEARAFVARLFSDSTDEERLLQVFDNGQIEKRHVCEPLEWYGEPHSFAEKNDRYVANAVALAGAAARRVLERGGLTPRDVDHVVFVSSTGLATPSVDAMLANALDFRGDVRRTPIWGLGCAGGAAGLSCARDLTLANPRARVLMVALELCSLTFQPNDRSKRNLVATSLFGDGAAAALVVGAGREPATGDLSLQLQASRSVLWKDTLDVMGWTVDGAGLHVVFSRDIPTIVRDRVRPSLVAFLASHRLALADLDHVVAHPGGAKVLAAYAAALDLPPAALADSRDVLREFGNMSSPTCLFVLERLMRRGGIRSGQRAVIAALGPGFSAEYVLAAAAGD
jgi:alkylresorcinol/alkylpyrone synthase